MGNNLVKYCPPHITKYSSIDNEDSFIKFGSINKEWIACYKLLNIIASSGGFSYQIKIMHILHKFDHEVYYFDNNIVQFGKTFDGGSELVLNNAEYKAFAKRSLYDAFIANIDLVLDPLSKHNDLELFKKYKYTGLWKDKYVECEFVNGKLNGPYVYDYEYGSGKSLRRITCNFNNGEYHGNYYFWDISGTTLEANYTNGSFDGEYSYNSYNKKIKYMYNNGLKDGVCVEIIRDHELPQEIVITRIYDKGKMITDTTETRKRKFC